MSAPSWLANLPREQATPNDNFEEHDVQLSDDDFDFDDDSFATSADQSQPPKPSDIPRNDQPDSVDDDAQDETHDNMQNQGTFIRNQGTWAEYKEHSGELFWVDSTTGESTYVRPSNLHDQPATKPTTRRSPRSPPPPSSKERDRMNDNPRRPNRRSSQKAEHHHQQQQQQQQQQLPPVRPSGRERLAAAKAARMADGNDRQASAADNAPPTRTKRSPPPPRINTQGTTATKRASQTATQSPPHRGPAPRMSSSALSPSTNSPSPSPKTERTLPPPRPSPGRSPQHRQSNARTTRSEINDTPPDAPENLNDEVEHEETTESPKSYYSATSSVERANQFRSPKSEAMEGRREGELEEIDIDRFSPRSATQASAADGSTGDTGEREQEQVDEAKGTGTGTEKGRSNSRVASVTGQVVDLSKGLRNRVGSGVKGLWGRVAGKKHEHESSEGREQTTAEADEFEFKSEEGESHDAYVLGERERAESQHAAALQQSADDDQESQSGQVQNSFGAGESSAGDAMNQSIDFQAESNVPVIHCRKQGGLLFLSEATAAHDPLWESEAGEGDNAQVSVIDEAFVVFSLIKNTVARAGLEMSDVVRVDLALTDLNLLESVDDAFFQFFSQEPFPARTVTAGCQLPGTARLQATCIVSDPNVETLGVTGGGGGRRALRKGVRGSIRGGPEKVDTVRWLGSKVPVALGGIGYRSSSLSDATGALVKQRERRKADVVLRVSELLCSVLTLSLTASSGYHGVSSAAGYLLAVSVLMMIYAVAATAVAGSWWVENERPQWKPKSIRASDMLKVLAEDSNGKIVTALLVCDFLFLFLAATSFTGGAVLSSALASAGATSSPLAAGTAFMFGATVLLNTSVVLTCKWYFRKFPKPNSKLTSVRQTPMPVQDASESAAKARMLV